MFLFLSLRLSKFIQALLKRGGEVRPGVESLSVFFIISTAKNVLKVSVDVECGFDGVSSRLCPEEMEASLWHAV